MALKKAAKFSADSFARAINPSDIATVSVLVAIMALMAIGRSAHYLLFHTMAEVFAIVVSFSIFMLTWVGQRYLTNGYLIVLGAAYGAIGLVDVFHTLTFRGMNLFPGVSTNYPTQFWLSARFLEALALLCAPFVISRKPNFYLVSVGFMAVALAASGAVTLQVFPATFIDGVGLTAFKVYGEYIIIAMMTFALVMLYRVRQHFEPRIFLLLSTSLVLAVVTEFCFTRYGSFYDFTNELGHYFRFLTVALAFMAIVISGVRQPMDLIFREVDALNKKLAESEAFNLSVFDSIIESVAVLDANGIIIAVNAPWRKFAQANGAQHLIDKFVGQDYLRICADAASPPCSAQEASVATAVADGIRSVLEGAQTHFELVYPCHSPQVRRWFHVYVSPLYESRRGAVVSHVDITASKLVQDAVLESEQRYRLLFDMSADAIMLTAPDGRIFEANPAACRMFQRSQEEICRLGRNAVVDTSDPQLAVAIEVRRQTGSFAGENVFLRKDGSKFPGEVSTSMFTDKNGNARTSMIIRDISERKRIEAALQESERRMSAVFQSSPIGIVISRLEDGKVLDVNDACLRLYHYTRDEALGHTVLELGTYVNPEQRVELLAMLREQGFVNGFLIDFRTHDGSVGVLETSGRIIELKGEACLLAMLTDVTERQRAQALVHDQAFHDALTQLPNRRLLGNRLQQAMVTAKRRGCFGALMCIDLDNFKQLNDLYGHDMGDLLLIEAAARLTACVREMDTAARVGGDEFVIILNELNADLAESTLQTATVAEKVRSALSLPYRLTAQRAGQSGATVEHLCTASIGVTLFFNDEVTPDDLLSRADLAMYEAKRSGRSVIRFHKG